MSQKSTPKEKNPEVEAQPEQNEFEAEDLAYRFYGLRKRARRLRREAEEAESEAAELLKKHPFLGNLLGVTNKVIQKNLPPPAEKKKKTDPQEEGSKSAKKRRRKETISPGNTMSEQQIAREGGEVPRKTGGMPGRLERMELDERR